MVRPTTRKVFEALFQILDGMLEGFEGLQVADVFAGSGQLGLEALRRGAAHVVWLEKDAGVVADLRNTVRAEADLRERTAVMRGDAIRGLEKLEGLFDLILMDPPYSQDLGAGSLEVVARRGLLREGGVCVVEHHHKELLPEQAGTLVRARTRDFGETRLSFYRTAPRAAGETAGVAPHQDGREQVD